MSESGNVPQTGILKRLEALIALAMQRGAAGLAYITAARNWGNTPNAPVSLTTAYQVIGTVAVTPTTTGKLRLIGTAIITCGGTADTVLLAVSHGSAVIVPDFALSTPLTMAANAALQCDIQVDLDKLTSPVVLTVGTLADINLLAKAATNGRLTAPALGCTLEVAEVQ